MARGVQLVATRDPIKRAAAQKRYAQTEKGKATRARSVAAYRASHREELVKRRSHLMTRYGLTVADWECMLITQAGRCDCCKEPMDGRVCVDHNHGNGQVRALVCQDCNIAISWVEGKALKLSQAQDYVIRHN